jgi:(5-formylfuran-3-yl)methyl phosphate synthase
MSNRPSADPLTCAFRPQRPLLLVSVASASEAVMARSHGADWIDLKNPAAGSLGAPQPATAQAVVTCLADFPRKSIALGELAEIQNVDCAAILLDQAGARFPIAKVGLAGIQPHVGWQDDFQELQCRIAPTRLVPVLYADGQRCAAAGFPELLRLIERVRPPFLLIDTCIKDGRGLLEWLDLHELNAIRAELASWGTGLVLAGSLRLEDLEPLLTLSPAAIAVRGAVCAGARTGALSGARMAEWTGRLQAVGR